MSSKQFNQSKSKKRSLCVHFSDREKANKSYPLHNFFYENKVYEINSIETLKRLIDNNPYAAMTKNQDGDLPLHLLCKRWYPEEISSLIMEANLDAIVTKDRNGNFPLNVACSSHGNSSLIIRMIKYFPFTASSKNKDGNYPLHTLCLTPREDPPPSDCIRALTEAAPHVISEPDSEGDSLILKACDWVFAASSLVTSEDNDFFVWPTDMTELERSISNLQCFLNYCPKMAVTALQYMMSEIEKKDSREYFHIITAIALHIIVLTIMSTKSNSNLTIMEMYETSRSIIMSFLFSSEEIPVLSLKCFLLLFGPHWKDSRLLAHSRDINTNEYPLHQALKIRKSKEGKQEIDGNIIKYSLLLNRRAATYTDSEGLCPLHLCLKHGVSINIVKLVFEAYPATLYSLPSFTSVQSKNKDMAKGGNAGLLAAMYDAPVDVIFYLFQQQPLIMINKSRKRCSFDDEDELNVNCERVKIF